MILIEEQATASPEIDKMDSLAVPRKLWEHPDPQSTTMYKFMQSINRKHNLRLKVRPKGPN